MHKKQRDTLPRTPTPILTLTLLMQEMHAQLSKTINGDLGLEMWQLIERRFLRAPGVVC